MPDNNVTMPRNTYDALRSAVLSRNTDEARRLLEEVDDSNSIRRYFLAIRWQDVGGTPPPPASITSWPTDQTYMLELPRPISRQDVEQVLRQQATNPVSIMVTPDRNARLGWSLLGDYRF